MVASIAALHGCGSVFIHRSRSRRGGKRSFGENLATAILHAVADLPLVNIQSDVIHRFHGGASFGVSESASAEFSFSTPSAPPPTYTFKLPGTNLLDEWIGDLPLIAEVVASQLAKITCSTGRQYIENRFQRQSASPGP